MQLFVVDAEENQSHTFLLDQLVEFRVVVTLVHATENEHCRFTHALESIPAGVDVGGLRVVDELHPSDLPRLLETMLHTGKTAESLTDELIADSGDVGRDTSRERVVEVVLATKSQFLQLHIERRGLLDDILLLLSVGDDVALMEFGEGEELRLDVVFLELSLDDGVVVPEDEGIVLSEVLRDAHLGVDIVLHLEVVAVEVVRRDVHENGNVGLEVVHVVELEA